VIEINGDTQNDSFTANYSRRWTYAGGASPIGLKLNGFTHRRIQPEVIGNAGFLIASRDIPVQDSSSFGIEPRVNRFRRRSVITTYRTTTLGQRIQAWIRRFGK